uniref:EF-hand domain-containing protein n=1 Tax=Octopus bimaculoides TaxID=37653 RepID=A0A0L8GX12_OCTBM
MSILYFTDDNGGSYLSFSKELAFDKSKEITTNIVAFEWEMKAIFFCSGVVGINEMSKGRHFSLQPNPCRESEPGEVLSSEVREVFDLFDFWDGRDGDVDAYKVGDLLRCLGMNPTNAQIHKHGGTKKMGEKSYKLEEILPIYEEMSLEKDKGTNADFMEAFKTFDREGQGFISSAEMRNVLMSLGEKITDAQMTEITQFCDIREDIDGNIKYEEFIKRVMSGPFPDGEK